MKYITLEHTDLELSRLCLGGGQFGAKLNREQSFEILDAYVREGGTFIDTANVYCRWVPGAENSSEKILGEWMRSRGASRNVVIATKGGHYDLAHPEINRVTKEDVAKDLDESLESLGLDTLDFYWLHRDDPQKPIEEILDMLEDFRKSGKIRYYGLSNYTTDRIRQGKAYLESKGISGPWGVSNQWSLATFNDWKDPNQDPTIVKFTPEEYAWHKETKVPIIPFSSTASGFFEKLKRAGVRVENGVLIDSGRAKQELPASMRATYWNEENLRIYEKLLKVQSETGYSLQALSLAYLQEQPFQVIPIGGVRNLEQLKGFLEAGEMDLKE
ncbi:MAG: aldo/keto reductase [Eubacteriales bacterium]|nr:aldo/keto reductase [Eubacteriales bacterium]